MPISAQVFAAVAAALHVGIFVMESLLWRRPTIWRRFGVAQQADADVTAPMAFNQGFYNLFLAVGIAIGLAVGGATGHAVAIFCCFSIVGAAVVLSTGGRKYARAAITQGVTPAVALLCVLAF